MTYLAYAGVGSQKTPTHIQNVMRHVAAYLASEGWTLRSGGANGADTAFEDGVDNQSINPSALKEIYLPWVGFNNNPSELHPRNYPFSVQEMSLSAQIHPAWDKCSPSAKLMHQRNLRQMVGCQAVCGDKVVASKFVVCWTENGLTKGGTGQAIRIARACDIPIINLGMAIDAAHLEQLVLKIDELQSRFKKEFRNAETRLGDHPATPAGEAAPAS